MPAEAKPSAAAVVDAARKFLLNFKTPGPILAAVSGGSDSTGLLLALNEALKQAPISGFSLFACTVDHGLRADSAQEALAVAQLCARLGIPHLTRRWDGEKPSTGLQAAARHARYALLADAARETGAICVITGHTLDDQQETILMRAARSDGGAGLSGMSEAMLFSRETWILRPFLAVRRADIRGYLLDCGQGWIDDPSNESDVFERVRMRRSLAGRDAEPAEREAPLTDRAQASRVAAELLADHASVSLGLVATVRSPLVVASTRAEGLRAILSLAACLGGRAHLAGLETATRLATFLRAGSDGRMTAGRVVFDRRSSGLYLYREARDLPVAALAPGGECVWDGRFLLCNDRTTPVVVAGGAVLPPIVAGLIAAGLPEGVARQAAKAAPYILPESPGENAGEPANPAIRLAPWDTFLPRFDLILANRCASLFGREPFKPLPVHDVLT